MKQNDLSCAPGKTKMPETYAVILKETGRAVGSVGIMIGEQERAPMSETEGELGCWIGVPYWGQGLIPEALEALLHRCFTELNCTAVWYGYFDGNTKSKRVQEKCGFYPHHTEYEKEWMGEKKIEHFSRQTKAEWEARKLAI